MKKLFIIPLLLLALLAGCGESASSDNDMESTRTVYAMDTVMDLTVYGDADVAEGALSDAENEIQRLDDLLSCQDENSEIFALNAAAADRGRANTVDVGQEISDLLTASKQYSASTGGAFDVTVAPIVALWDFTGDDPSVPDSSKISALLPYVGSDNIFCSGSAVSLADGVSVDLGGIAKGYASDRLAEIWDEDGVASAVASLGGNVYARGAKLDGSLWRVAVKDPNSPESYIGILSCANSFVITSGGYQRYFEQDGVRYHHILDPKTGWPANSGLTSVTIIASSLEKGSGTMCDALSTALFVMGEDNAVEFWRSGEYDFDMILVTDDNRLLVTENIAGSFDASESGDAYAVETITKS